MSAAFQNGRPVRAPIAVLCALLVLIAACAGAEAQSTRATPPATVDQTTANGAIAKVPGTVLDRVIAIVNGDLILDSDVDEERRFEAFEPYREHMGSFSRDKAIERLINRDLILQQIKLQPEDQVSDSDVTKQIEELRKTIPACKQYHCETEQGWDRFVAAQGFTEASLFKRWKQRMEVLEFIEERFRMGITITPEQIKDYYEKTMLPEYASRHAKPPKLMTISHQIQEVLLQQQVTNLLSDWLKSLRAQGSVVVLHPDGEAP